MESALSPRDIQARIRAGESLEQVAQAAGVPMERVEVFAAPVLAEREHVAGAAQAAPARRTGESSTTRSLRSVVTERLQHRGIDIDDVSWDAWREPDRSWTLVARYHSGSAEHEGRFRFDQRARFSVARNDEARWLIGDVSPLHGPQPGRHTVRQGDPDQEPTVDLNDELALVRAVQPGGRTANPAPTVAAPTSAAPVEPAVSNPEPDDYAEADLQEVDGVYDIVPQQSELDVLYEMLSSFNEDSVNIYAGLTQPVVDELLEGDQPPTSSDVDEARAEEAEEAEVEHEAPSHQTIGSPQSHQGEQSPATGLSLPPGQPEGLEQDPLIAPHLIRGSQTGTEPSQRTAETRPAETEPAGTELDGTEADGTEAGEPEAESIPVESKAPTQPTPRKRTPRRKSGRAQVPSWDEIMFGGPKDS